MTCDHKLMGARLLRVVGPCPTYDMDLGVSISPSPRANAIPWTVAPCLILRERRRASRLPFGAFAALTRAARSRESASMGATVDFEWSRPARGESADQPTRKQLLDGRAKRQAREQRGVSSPAASQAQLPNEGRWVYHGDADRLVV
jgi:hypothetical protein